MLEKTYIQARMKFPMAKVESKSFLAQQGVLAEKTQALVKRKNDLFHGKANFHAKMLEHF